LTIFVTGMSFGGCGNELTDEEGERQGVCFVNMECRRCCGQHNSGFNSPYRNLKVWLDPTLVDISLPRVIWWYYHFEDAAANMKLIFKLADSKPDSANMTSDGYVSYNELIEQAGK
jgi:hypothetical protein